MSYGTFEAIEASESEHRIAANAAARELDVAIDAVKVRHSSYLNLATSQKDFFSRVNVVRGDMRNIVAAHGMEPRNGIMNKVIKACKNDARQHWLQRQASEGTEVADAAPATDLSTPVSTLADSPVGAVTARRRRTASDVPGYSTQPGMPATESTNTAAEPMTPVARRASFRDFLAAEEHGGFNGPLIPEGNFDAYLRQVTGPETDEAASEPFVADSEDRWENTGNKTSRFEAALRQAEDYKSRGRTEADGSNYDFTGSPETQYHHKQDVDWGGIRDKQSPESIEEMYERARRGEPVHAMRAAATAYARWCGRHGLRRASRKNVMAFGQRAPHAMFTDLVSGIQLAHQRQLQRVASGKDHLQTSTDAITKMLNELAEEFQKSIMPLQDALQSVTYAQQAMQAQQSPMNVMPPGSVNVMPEGQAPGGPPMAGQGMPAQPGPGGVSPMVDPNATGGAPAGPGAPPGAGAGAIPPEVAQILQQVPPEILLEVATQGLMGGGGAPAPGGAPAGPPPGGGGAPAQRPVANVRRFAEFPFGGGGGDKKDDDKPKDDEKKSDGGDSEKSESKPPEDKKDSGDGPPKEEKSEGGEPKPKGPPPAEGGDAPAGSPEELDDAISTVLQLLDLGDIDTAQAIANSLQITDEDINGFINDDSYESGDPFEQGPPPEAGPPAGPPEPPAGLPMAEEPPLPGPPPELIQARAERYLRWASKYNLPINGHTLDQFRQADFQQDFARDIADGVPDTKQQARFVNYLNRWNDMRANEQGMYNPNPELVTAGSRRPLV